MNRSSGGAFENAVLTPVAGAAHERRDEADISTSIDPEGGDRPNQPRVQHSQEFAIREKGDKAGTRHPDEVAVIRGGDLSVARDGLPDLRGGIGDR